MRRLQVGDRVSAMRHLPGTIALDYSGTVTAADDRARTEQRISVRFSDGVEETMSAHPDFVEDLTRPFAAAREFRRLAPDLEPSQEVVQSVLADARPAFTWWDIRYALHLLKYSPKEVAA